MAYESTNNIAWDSGYGRKTIPKLGTSRVSVGGRVFRASIMQHVILQTNRKINPNNTLPPSHSPPPEALFTGTPYTWIDLAFYFQGISASP